MRAAARAVQGLALALAMIACQHADAPPPAAPKGPTACDRAADSMVGAMLAHLAASDAATPASPPTEEADALRRLIRVRCEQDGWSADATRCLIAMQKLEDAAPCAALLTDDQQAALVRDQEAQAGAGAKPGARPAGAAPAASGGAGVPGAAGAAGGPGTRAPVGREPGGSGHPGNG